MTDSPIFGICGPGPEAIGKKIQEALMFHVFAQTRSQQMVIDQLIERHQIKIGNPMVSRFESCRYRIS